jgi:hypothetical protein
MNTACDGSPIGNIPSAALVILSHPPNHFQTNLPHLRGVHIGVELFGLADEAAGGLQFAGADVGDDLGIVGDPFFAERDQLRIIDFGDPEFRERRRTGVAFYFAGWFIRKRAYAA